MLTSQQALAQYDFANYRVAPDRLTRKQHSHYQSIAERLVEIYSCGIGLTRQQLHRQAEAAFENCDDCPLRRMAALIKLLDDRCHYNTDRGRKAAELRKRLFLEAAKHHPLVEVVSGVFDSEHWAVKHRLAREFKTTWPQLERNLFADVMEFHTLSEFQAYASGAELLARYNVAQVQACLYRAVRMTLWARNDLKSIVRLIKLSRLMHSITRQSDGAYQMTLTGPASLLRTTRRYGVAMAKIIPGLLACRDWNLTALISVGAGQRKLSLQLSSQDGLTSPNPTAEEFDSEVEADLMQKWNAKRLPGWKLEHESELLIHGQKVFIPDFVATQDSGRQVFIEIIGFWTPEYLSAKVETLRQFSNHKILLIAQESARPALDHLSSVARDSILWYKNKISVEGFLAALQNH